MGTDRQHSIRIGTLVDANAPDPVHYIEEILPHGFESFQLTFGASVRDPNLEGLAERTTRSIENSGAVISALGVYGNPLLDTEAGARTRASWESLIRSARFFGTSVVAGFTGRLKDVPIHENLPRFTEVFRPIADLADEFGVRIAFENCAMGGNWKTGDWNIAHGPDAWSLIFDALQTESVGLEWEPCHQMVNLIDPLPQLRNWVDRIYHVHGKCCTIHWDVVKKYGVRGSRPFAFHRTPGFGDADWKAVLSDLRAGGFSGAIDIEGWHDPVYCGELEMTGQVHALNYLKDCRGGEYVQNPS